MAENILTNNFDHNQSKCNNNETNVLRSTSPSLSVGQEESGNCGGENNQNSRPSSSVSGVMNCKSNRMLKSAIIDVIPVEHHQQTTRREENPFSFKHFLSREASSSISLGSSNCNVMTNTSSSSITASNYNKKSSVSTSIGLGLSQQSTLEHQSAAPGGSGEYLLNGTTFSNNNQNTETNSPHSSTPEICASGGSSKPTTSSFHISSNSYQSSTGARPKVPQQQQQPQLQNPTSSISTTSISSLTGETSKMKRSPRFPSFDSQASLAEFSGSKANTNESMTNFFPSDDYDRQQFVHRSYSNYDIDVPQQKVIYGPHAQNPSSPRQRLSPTGCSPDDDDDLHHAALNLGLHINASLAGGSRNNRKRVGILPLKTQQPTDRPSSRPASEFSAVLPDFVQDHLVMEQWYSDMNSSSPPNSPASPDIPGLANPPSVADVVSVGGVGGGGEMCQTLPDFLSDGPIIHSASGRLADVAAGLPELDSPEENLPSQQLARFRLENDRLRRELDESRQALADQTRRAGELERRLEQARYSETSFSANLAQSLEQVGENLDRSNKRAAAAQSEVNKLKQKVKQLTGEIDALRRETKSLRRDEGAVGGDQATRRTIFRPQQISRDLMMAASNAEGNLRQLLSGVENLRQMATAIENIDSLTYEPNNPANPIMNEEFLSDCDVDYDDFTGPAL